MSKITDFDFKSRKFFGGLAVGIVESEKTQNYVKQAKQRKALIGSINLNFLNKPEENEDFQM